MKNLIPIALSILFLATHAVGAGYQLDTTILSGDFDTESAPADPNTVRSDEGKVSYIKNNSWVSYQNFDFGAGATYFSIEGASASAGGTLELRTGSVAGPLIGTVNITNTGGFTAFQQFGVAVPPTLIGVQNLYFKFVGGGGFLFDIRTFSFQRISPGLKQPGSLFGATNFDSESAPGGAPIVANGGVVESITDGSWVAYHNFDFGKDTNLVTFVGATPGAGGTVELRLDSATGARVGSIDIDHTGSWAHYRPFTGVLASSVSGVHSLYLRFVDSRASGGNLFNLKSFTLGREAPRVVVPYAADEDQDGVPKLLEYALGMHPESKDGVPLRVAPKIPAAGIGAYDIEVRLRADSAMAIKALVSTDLISWDEVPLVFQNGSWQTNHPTITISEVIPQADGLSLIRLKDSRTNTRLFARMSVNVLEGDLNVYPPVPGLGASPYYTFSVQKVSGLNAPLKQNATNWLSPFAWFTRCVDYPATTGKTAYYAGFIGSWSHTYCNFELDTHTPIVVKITRLNKPGAPSGPITTAAVHPAHKVDSCEVINGAVYVTMSHPALIAVDIDGQMDSRDAPRATPTGFNSSSFPYRNELNGAHGVTIFANPVIKNKPQLGDPGVFAVEPGTLPPTSGAWTTLYFKPGIHKLSVDAGGNEREWQTTDPLFLTNGKSYYIPGDAIVYGNLNDYDDNQISTNIRVFGHGTISGTKMPHYQDFAAGPLPEAEHKKLRMLQLTKASNCTYEGITIADPAEHGVYIQGGIELLPPNYIKWVKNISWRVNNDGGGVTGNGYVEDCFFRHQDDALYVRGMGIRRTVFWSDVNGTPLRCGFVYSDRGPNFPPTLPQDFIIEDCDVIYSRGVFANSNSTANGIIGTPNAYDDQKTYADGALNTGQHLIFRNIRISDPRPGRYLFGFHPTADDPATAGPWAGIRFENIDYQYPHTWGWKNRFIGAAAGSIRYFSFDNISIGGTPVDATFLNDPTKVETAFFSDAVIK